MVSFALRSMHGKAGAIRGVRHDDIAHGAVNCY
jgi:hypothetical protein